MTKGFFTALPQAAPLADIKDFTTVSNAVGKFKSTNSVCVSQRTGFSGSGPFVCVSCICICTHKDKRKHCQLHSQPLSSTVRVLIKRGAFITTAIQTSKQLGQDKRHREHKGLCHNSSSAVTVKDPHILTLTTGATEKSNIECVPLKNVYTWLNVMMPVLNSQMQTKRLSLNLFLCNCQQRKDCSMTHRVSQSPVMVKIYLCPLVTFHFQATYFLKCLHVCGLPNTGCNPHNRTSQHWFMQDKI